MKLHLLFVRTFRVLLAASILVGVFELGRSSVRFNGLHLLMVLWWFAVAMYYAVKIRRELQREKRAAAAEIRSISDEIARSSLWREMR